MKLQRVENSLDCMLQNIVIKYSLNVEFFDSTPEFTKFAFSELTNRYSLI